MVEEERPAGGESKTAEEDIVIRIPRIDRELREALLDLIPGRALLRVLCNLPDEVLEHARGARRERLLALRSVIDALITETERPVRRRRAQEVQIE